MGSIALSPLVFRLPALERISEGDDTHDLWSWVLVIAHSGCAWVTASVWIGADARNSWKYLSNLHCLLPKGIFCTVQCAVEAAVELAKRLSLENEHNSLRPVVSPL